MDRCFEGQVALVTGGGKGIGLGIAKALSERGAKVAVAGRHSTTLDSAVDSCADALAVLMDVKVEDSVRKGISAVVEWGGRLDLLVNNAGIGLLDTPLTETSTDAWRDVIETNLTGAFYATKFSWPHLTASQGQILNVSSIAGTRAFAGASAYCASKFGLSGFTEVLKLEGADAGIRVLALCPGAASTEIWGAWATEEVKSRMMSAEDLGALAAAMFAAPRNLDLGPWIVVNAVSPWKE
jgi:NAD(P)-dependent dehydrogenase (short-subunit alcohol dehydrogenase family)